MQKIVIASTNKGKIKEIKEILERYEVIPYSDILGTLTIKEDGRSFKENAIIKAKVIFKKLSDKKLIVLSDDSGICVDALGGNPGIYSARFAGAKASDQQNLQKLIDTLKEKKIKESRAHYTCAVAIASKYGIDTVHGWMYGKVITTPKGSNGFGYDPIFVPEHFNKTVAELPKETKKQISHRSMAFELAKIILKLKTN